jgi:hypothetical protein
MQVRVKWVDGMMFLGESESGHAVVMDGPPELGGNAVSSSRPDSPRKHWIVTLILLSHKLAGKR